MPWAKTEQVNVTWNEWHFDNHLADRVPHEGVSRLITTSKREFKAHIVRRGLAFIMEADYAGTPEGDEQYNHNVMSISQAVQETQNHDTVFALLSSKNYYKLWQQRFGTMQVSLRQITDHEINLFGSVSLPGGDDVLSVVVEDHKRLMAKKGVVPNMIVLWPGSTIYMSMVPPMRTEYWKAGDQGVLRRERGPDSLNVFRGLPVFEARDFDVYDNSPPVQLLTRPVQISEYYSMRFDRRHENVKDYTSKERGIVIYDENIDQWRKISFLEAFDNARLFEKDGKYANKLGHLVEAYNDRGQRPKSDPVTREEDQDEGLIDSDGDQKPTFFLTTPDNEGEYMLLRYFGQMEMQHATDHDMQRVGETIAAKMGGLSPEAWQNMVTLVNDIESQQYNHDYWTAVIAANTKDSLANNGTFVGEETPDDVRIHWGMRSKQRQWKPNAYGSLRLPRGAMMKDIAFPAGYANAPGLLTLAAEARDPTSPWNAVGKRAERAVGLLQHMLDTLRTRLPLSAALDDKGRSPWFHRPDSLTTFFENVVGVSRDPMFMMTLPAVGGGAGLSDASKMSSIPSEPIEVSRKEDMKWFSLPGAVASLADSELLVARDEAGLAELERIMTSDDPFEEGGLVVVKPVRSFTTVAAEGASVAYYSPTLGGVVSVHVSEFTGGIRYTPELRAFGMMPAGNSPEAIAVRRGYYAVMKAVDNADTRRRFAKFAHQLGLVDPVRMWRAVHGMSTTKADLTDAINTIYITDDAGEDEIHASRRRVSELASIAPKRSEWKDMKPLNDVWDSFDSKGEAGARISALSFEEVADDAQRALDLEREIMAVSDIDAFGQPFSANVIATIQGGVTPTPGNTALYSRLATELSEVIARIRTTLDNQGATTARAEDILQRRADSHDRGASVHVADTREGIARGRYYRTPLTMSLHMLQSLSDTFGKHTAKPLILPSDPASGHTVPYTWDGDEGDAVLPGSSLRRSNFNPISSAIGVAMDAPNYATLPEINRDSSLRPLDATPFITRHAQAGFVGAPSNGNKGDSAVGRRRLFDDEDVDESDDSDNDDVAQVFAGGRSSRKLSQSKRARVSGGYNGDGNRNGDGNPHDGNPHDGMAHSAELRFTRTGVFAERWKQANEIADPLVRMCTLAMLMTKCDRASTWRKMIENDILPPVDLIAWRPLIVHDMASAILMKGGLETGANLHGGANAAKVNDGVSKLIYYNFTFRSKAVVWKEKNVAIIENIKFEGYSGGLSGEFVKKVTDLDREDVDRPSIIVTAIGIAERTLPKMMDFSGSLQVPQVNVSIDGQLKHHYASAEYYDEYVWKLSQRVTQKSPEHEDFFDRADRTSVAAFQGTQYGFNRIAGRYSKFTEPQGHLKRNMCYPGAASILNGTAKSFINYAYDTVHIE